MIDREPAVPDERRIRFRIGINLGDVIAESDDIFGDGVNVAARLEALAEPGGICISRTVRDHIRDKLPYPFEDLGERSVKNIARPVRVYALRPEVVTALPASSAPPSTSISQPALAPRLSIVVLPFANLGNNPEDGIGLTVNTVTPGLIATDMAAAIPDKVIDKLKRQIPGGHALLYFRDVNGLDAAAVALGQASRDSDSLVLQIPTDDTPESLMGLLERIDRHSLHVERVTVHMPDLDDVFLALTGNPKQEQETSA